uniref:hypothetical protein n=1 Tax=Ornithobacterium rhinotracheale TaxID=28251 RepID=UPI00129D1D40|nr:hypothetical protein [Ornithobacterium rhinotracheale]
MDKKMPLIKSRVIYFIESQGIEKKKFYEKTSIAASNFKSSGLKSELGGDKIAQILSLYPNINPEWLLLGEGEMLKSPAKQEEPTQQVVEPQEAYNKVAHLEEKIAFLQRENQLLQENKALLEDKVKSLEEQESTRIQELESEIARLTQENRAIKSRPQNRKTG